MNLLSQVNLRDRLFRDHPGASNLAATPGSLISYILPNIIVIAGVVFFIIIIVSGFNLIINAGGSASPQVIAKHKQTFYQGLIGFLIVASAYFILQMVSVITGVRFNAPGI